MSKNYTPKNFAIQQVFEILLSDVQTKSPIAYLDNTKTSGLTNEQTMVYPTGSRGNVYIGGGFGHSRRASLSVTNATWNTSVMGIQIGSEVVVGSNKNAMYYDVAEYDGSKLKTKFKAQGTAGSEIGTIYSLGADNSYIDSYKQVASTPKAGEFTYSSATGEITFATSVSLTKGDRFAIAYNIDTGDSAQTISVSAAGQPDTAYVTCMGLVKDVETGEFYQCQITGLAQISGAWAWDLAADGEPASQSLDIEFVKKYSAKDLYEIIIWNEEDAVTIA